MMKILFKALFLFSISFLSVACSDRSSCKQVTAETLEAGFITPPDSIQTAIYWYWMSDNISEANLVKDLYAMKEVGINRAYIGNIGFDNDSVYVDSVKFNSEAWWKAMHTTLKTATELGIDIGLFNSPGWSQSGGPWVKPDQAMRYLASASTAVRGGQKVDIILNKPSGDFQDVKVIAYPAIKSVSLLSPEKTHITASEPLKDIKNLIDGKKETVTVLANTSEKDKSITIDFKMEEPVTVRSLKIYASDKQIDSPAKVEAIGSEGRYSVLKEFVIDRYNPQLNVGFDPYAPVVVSLPETRTKALRITISKLKPEAGLREIEFYSTPFVERYPEKTLAKMYQTPLPYWHEYQWQNQPNVEDKSLVVDPTSVLDITKYLSGDKLTWDAPEGDWVILRTGMLPTGVTNAPARKDATGLEIDKMSVKHARSHFEAYMGEVIRRIPAADRKSWKYVVQDSYETGGQNFTDDFLEIFKNRYGYDPTPYIPAYYGIVVGSEDASDRFLWDMRRLVADKVAYDYVGGLRDVSHDYGLKTWLENYGHWGFPGEFLQYGGQSDEIGGEFWSTGTLGDIENRAASSCGHIYGKTKIWAESFTVGGCVYEDHPDVIKRRGDRFFSEGINASLLHLYIHQAIDKEPGINAWFGHEFNRNNTWFYQMDLFTTYLKRVNFMLQQGVNVADVAYFIGEDAPKMTGVTDPELPRGYQFDYINAEVIEKSLTVKDGLLTLPHGTQYKILVLPKLETMRPELLVKIKKLIEAGAVVLGPAPSRSPSLQGYPKADQEIKDIASSIWGKINPSSKYAKIGHGMIINGLNMQEALDLIKCPADMKIAGDTTTLYGHRKIGDNIDAYFITNQQNNAVEIKPEFRIKGMQPELWNPVDGSVRKLASFTETATGTIVPIKLEVNESAFVVFRYEAESVGSTDIELNYPDAEVLVEITEPWKVTFEKERKGPAAPLKMTVLEDITQNPNFDIKHYSGKIVYQSSYNLHKKPENKVLIELTDLGVMAKIKINGDYAGGIWTRPYRLDISKYVKEGNNVIEIEVVTTWKNRMIGDLTLPKNKRLTWAPIYPEENKRNGLQKSGLIGPVKITEIKY